MTFDRKLQPDPTAYFEEQGLKLTGPRKAKWKTTECRFHGGRKTMRINVTSGGWCCMSCGQKGGDVLAYHLQAYGLEFVEAAKQLGCWVDDGQPARQYKPTPLTSRAALSAMAFEATLTAIAAGNIAKGVLLTDSDRSRLMQAANRINRMAEVFA